MKAPTAQRSETGVMLTLRPFKYAGVQPVFLTIDEARALRDSLTAVLAEGDNRV